MIYMMKELVVLSLILVIPLNAHAQIIGDGTDHVDVYEKHSSNIR